jgi:hypothetical protein
MSGHRPFFDCLAKLASLPTSASRRKQTYEGGIDDATFESLVAKTVDELVGRQVDIGIDVVSDGEVPEARLSIRIKTPQAPERPLGSCSSKKPTRSIWLHHFTVMVMTSDMMGGWNGRCDQSPNTS